MSDIVDARQRAAAAIVRGRMATYEEMEDLINLGAYRKGANAEVDLAIEKRPETERFLRQEIERGYEFEQTRSQLLALAGAVNEGSG
ncbi:MAG: hypothetical protein HUU16_16500 [Candidatus Omnitrophica bacterium]|nr:hypothetical protein [Candidatus Omnitrophota bacterium]